MPRRASSNVAVVLVAIAGLLLPLLPSSPAAARGEVVVPDDAPRNADGTIPVVVEFDLTATGGSGLSPAQEDAAGSDLVRPAGAVPATVAQQRAATQVVAALPSDRANNPFRRLPYLATSVTVEEWAELASLPEVASIGVDAVVDTLLDRTLPIVGALPADGEEQVTVGGQAIDGAGRTVAVIDTGVNAGHEMFIGMEDGLQEACFVRDGGCPNAEDEDFDKGAAAARGDHGTHVAAIALGRAATTTIGTGVVDVRGVAPAADLVAIQTFREEGSGAFVSDLARAMEWLADGVETGMLTTLDAVNLSLGTPPVDTCPSGGSWGTFRAAVDDLESNGVLTIAAAGNDAERTRMGAPACIDNVFSVANARTDRPDTLASSSNVSAATDVAAPGTAVLAASAPGTSAYSLKTGTSMAAPHVAGVVAALRSVYPDAPIGALREALRSTLPGGIVIDDNRSDGQVEGLPLLDLRATVLAPGLAEVAAPTGVEVAGRPSTQTGGRLEVSWTAAADAAAYRAVAWPTGQSCTATDGETNCLIEGLPGETSFRVWVTATDDAGVVSSAVPGPDEPVVALTRPDAPRDLAVVVERDDGNGSLGATVRWSEPFDGGAEITSYAVSLSPSDDAMIECPEQTVSGNGVSCELASLTEDTSYTVSVTAENVQGVSQPAERTFTATDVPAPASSAEAEDLGVGGKVEVTWHPSGAGTVTGYRAELTAPEVPTRTCSTDEKNTSCHVTDLIDGVRYDSAVFAFNEAGDATAATGTAVTPTGPPGAPVNVVGERGDSKVTVSWDAPDNDGGAEVVTYTVTTTTRGGTAVPEATCSVTDPHPDPLACTVEGLTNGTAYTFQAQAFNIRAGTNEERAGALSDPSADVTPATVPGPPTGVTATAPTAGQLDVSWQLPADDGGGTIEGSTATAVPAAGGSGNSCQVSGDAPSCTIDLSSLTADTEFSVTVITTNEVGDSEPSEPAGAVLVTAPEPPPPPPSGDGGSAGGGGGGAAPPPDDDDPDPDADDDADTDDAPVAGADGSLPTPDEGDAELVVDGSPTTTSASNTISQVAISGGGVSAALSAADVDGITSPVRDGTLSLPPGGRVNLGVSGLAPGSRATAWLFSDPVRLGAITVRADGTLAGSVDIPASVAAGRHTLQLVLERADGTTLALSIGVRVAAIEGRFPDVRVGSTHWLAIERIADQRITLGAADGTYRPGDPVTRGQMAAFLDRQLGLPEVRAGTEVDLSDIAGTQHEAAIERIVAAGIAGGFTDGTFRPNEPVLRGQLATFLLAAAGLEPLTTGTATDVAGSTHEQAIHAVMAADIAGGYPDGTYRPREDVTRAQMATLLVGLETELAGS